MMGSETDDALAGQTAPAEKGQRLRSVDRNCELDVAILPIAVPNIAHDVKDARFVDLVAQSVVPFDRCKYSAYQCEHLVRKSFVLTVLQL